MTDERAGEAYEFEERLTVIGPKLNRSEFAPDFTLDHFDGQTIQGVTLADSDGSIRILNVVNSLDTPICDIETRRWEQLRSKLPGDVVVMTISMDLPFAQARWGQGADLGHQALSSHRSEEFGRSYGVLIKEWRAPSSSLMRTAGSYMSSTWTIRCRNLTTRLRLTPCAQRPPDWLLALPALPRSRRTGGAPVTFRDPDNFQLEIFRPAPNPS
jgi:thioredoxin-dependent peroxiredoxin